MEARGSVIVDPMQHVGEPSLRVDVVERCMGRTTGMSAIHLMVGKVLAAKRQGVDRVLSFDHDGTPRSAVAGAVRRYAGSLSPSGGAATSNAFTTPHSIA